jgi:hypothetical protein
MVLSYAGGRDYAPLVARALKPRGGGTGSFSYRCDAFLILLYQAL